MSETKRIRSIKEIYSVGEGRSIECDAVVLMIKSDSL